MILAMLGEAWRAMGANRLRTLLTMLGMVIGVGAVVLMMSIGQGAQYAIKQTIAAMGSNLFILISGSTSTSGVRSGGGGGYTLNVGDADAIAELPGVQAVAPIQPGSAQVVYGPNNWNTSVLGTTPDYLQARSWSIASGDAFTDSDVRSGTRVALIGKTAADNLFGDEDPVGKTFRIRQSPFVVIGTLALKGQGMSTFSFLCLCPSQLFRCLRLIWAQTYCQLWHLALNKLPPMSCLNRRRLKARRFSPARCFCGHFSSQD